MSAEAHPFVLSLSKENGAQQAGFADLDPDCADCTLEGKPQGTSQHSSLEGRQGGSLWKTAVKFNSCPAHVSKKSYLRSGV